MTENQIATAILDKAFEIHRHLGPGLLESAYHRCLQYELINAGYDVQSELPLPIRYKELSINHGYRIDLLIERKVVIELKAVDYIHAAHKAQTLTYLRLGGFKLGLLINFNEALLKNGIKRIVNNL